MKLGGCGMAASGESMVRISTSSTLRRRNPLGFPRRRRWARDAARRGWKQAAYRFQRAKADQEDDREQTIEL